MGKLYIIATPIGNLEDITIRAIRVLGEVDAIACEDTRYTRIIYERYKIPSPKIIFSYHEYNEERAGKRIIDLLQEDHTIGLCTKGGYPGISDPGYRIITDALDAGFAMEVIPGAGAVTTALLASGLPTSSYTFKGFPPRKAGPRKRFMESETELPHTLVFFESPLRTGKFLNEALDIYGNRMAAVCIELTKKFEETHRGYLSDLARKFKDVKIKGEVTIVIVGNNPKFISPGDSS